MSDINRVELRGRAPSGPTETCQKPSPMRGIKSICGKWMLVAAKSGIPRSGFYGFTHDEVLMAVGVLPRAPKVQELLDSARAALDAAAGLVWPERVYWACNRMWVFRVVDGFSRYVPVEKVRAPEA